MSALRSVISSSSHKASAATPALRSSGLLLTPTQRLTAHAVSRQVSSPVVGARYESQSAFGKFMETLKEQIKKNKELHESVKKLQDESGKA
ncbi:hypothetical protein BGW38_001046, partial [Lunasporangiospora selenospora]